MSLVLGLLAIAAAAATVLAVVMRHRTRSLQPGVDVPFSADARRALDAASQEARALGHDAIAPEHILLALTNTASETWWSSLSPSGVDASAIRSELLAQFPATQPDVSPSQLPFTARAVTAMRNAVHRAETQNQPETSTRELIWGVMRDRRSEAGQILRHHGVPDAA